MLGKLLIPGASIYQVSEQLRLEKKYHQGFSAFKHIPLHTKLGATCVFTSPLDKAALKLYSTCEKIDFLTTAGYLVGLAKIITGFALAALSAPLEASLLAPLGASLLLDGCLHAAYSLYQIRKTRWHALPLSSNTPLTIIYDRTTRVSQVEEKVDYAANPPLL
ncbi:MAG: hypothetical protein EBZ47_09180 [Chlamydiae bacterium]|nr:hypothetical protein [Chlamydiota bacterium]